MWLLLRIIGLYLPRQQIICIVYPTVWVWHGIERPHCCTTFGNHGNHKSTTRLHAYITHIDFFFSSLFFYFHLPFFSDATQIEPVDRYLNNQREKKKVERKGAHCWQLCSSPALEGMTSVDTPSQISVFFLLLCWTPSWYREMLMASKWTALFFLK